MKKQRLCRIILGISFVFVIPLLVTLYIYHVLSPSTCSFSETSTSTPVLANVLPNLGVQGQISDFLTQESATIQSLAPLLQFGSDWFKYNISFRNDFNIELVTTSPQLAVEASTTFFVKTLSGVIAIPFGKEVVIGAGLNTDQITNLMTEIALQPNMNQVLPVYPGGKFLLQAAPNLGAVCIDVSLQSKYFFPMYLELFVVWMGLLIILKEAIALVIFGFKDYFSSKNN
jgi:hypothetical protein